MRNRVYHLELDELVGNKIEGPTGTTFRCFRTSNHGDIGFDFMVKSNRTSSSRLILKNLNNMIVLVLMISLAYIIDGGAGDTENFHDVLIILTIMRQEQRPGSIDLSCIFLTVGDIRGQKLILVLG